MTSPSPLSSPEIGKIAAALVQAQGQFKPAVKDATNPHFNSTFVSLAGVLGAVSEALRRAGIALVQQTDVDAGGSAVLVTRIVHGESGEWLAGRYPLRPVKNDPQSEGSALTYARRYALMSLLGIAPEDDDDGHAASQTPKKQAAKRGNAAADPVAPDPVRDKLREEIHDRAAASGLMTWTDIVSDFASWSQGELMGSATNEHLTAYRDHLLKPVTA